MDDGPFGSAKYTYTLHDTVAIETTSDRCTYPRSNDHTRIICSWDFDFGQDPTYVATFRLGDKNDTLTFVNPSQDTYGADQFWLGAARTPTPVPGTATAAGSAAMPATTRSPSTGWPVT